LTVAWWLCACDRVFPPEEGAPPRQGAERPADTAPTDADIRALLAGETVATDRLPDAWRRLVADVEAGRVPLNDEGVPVYLDTRRERMSEAGHFRVNLTAPAEGFAMNRIATWELAVSTPAGAPVSGARIDVVGGMPLHGHGFPTEPAVGEEIAPGVYPLRGVRFGMRGWWQLMLAVTSEEATDVVAFDLVVSP
jgi:hypothetical protein